MLNALCHVHDDSSPLFLMFHGYGNDEHEMIRVIEAVGRHDPMSYISFRAPFEREYMGGYSWYPHGCGPEARGWQMKASGESGGCSTPPSAAIVQPSASGSPKVAI